MVRLKIGKAERCPRAGYGTISQLLAINQARIYSSVHCAVKCVKILEVIPQISAPIWTKFIISQKKSKWECNLIFTGSNFINFRHEAEKQKQSGECEENGDCSIVDTGTPVAVSIFASLKLSPVL